MPKPMRADARRNYERLLKEAALAFTEHGVDASLDDIAKRAGVGSGTLYRHFPTRQDLLGEVYADRIDELADQAVEFGASGRPPGQALADWLQELAEQLIRLRGLRALLGAAMADGSTPVISGCGGRLTDAAGELLTAARQAGAARADLETTEMLRLTHAVAMAAELGADGPPDVRRCLVLMIEGICGDDRRAMSL
ncbi:TetR/AcrR family transcriptional regulator [Streptomyces sp. SID10853]|uniref:TetR/AcrR family transcriptional regulator n=1 Tax=Streptomyces sp. SID10853 TaxID=2706028 RepID=UPI0013C2921F|nr:TetR/AcrR family transcriptional regulator [Streptomyces sp. SID10853]NDZ83406.1 TetR/AcrR family transcriptional regulator [Streptomyces sp. SID10853]